MPENDRIVDQVQRAVGGDAWFGSSVRAALEGVSADLASARPIPGAHTIGEIVLHLTAAAVAGFDAANAQLGDRIGDERDRALGSGVSVYVTLHGLAQHHAYHAGQIMLLKRAAVRSSSPSASAGDELESGHA